MSLFKFEDFISEVKLERNQNLSSIIPRSDMPQLDDAKLNELVGIFGATKRQMSADELKGLRTVQHHIDMEKVEAMVSSEITGTIVVSDDGYIVDGHHRASAAILKGVQLDVIVLGGDVVDILAKIKDNASEIAQA